MRTPSLVTGLISQAVAALVALVVAFGVPLTPEQMAAIMGMAAVAGTLATLALWARTVDRSAVVERLIGDEVVAGEANDMVPSGQPVRALGDEPRHVEEGEE